jgi:hypothetical protein
MGNYQLLKEVYVSWSFSVSVCCDAWAVKYQLFGFGIIF